MNNLYIKAELNSNNKKVNINNIEHYVRIYKFEITGRSNKIKSIFIGEIIRK